MLILPDVIEAEPVREFDLVQRFVKQAGLEVGVPGTRQLKLVEQAELHMVSSLRGSGRFADGKLAGAARRGQPCRP